jgi:sterol desaturase/sphingolipid hydroxylase (fatty acid hydroxylase superfamily)
MGMQLGIFGALLAAAAAAALPSAIQRPGHFLALFAGGVLVWTIVEYLMHRLAFHGFAPHWQHHAEPTDPVWIVAPLAISLPGAAILFGAFSLATRSWIEGATMAAGAIAGYLAYEQIHLRIHQPAPGGPLLRALRKHHYYHHFASDQVCYGVTSPLWDWIFRSVPARDAKLHSPRS